METLISKVALLLTFTMLFGAIGTWLGRNIRSGWTMLGLGLAFIIGTIVVLLSAQASAGAGITLLFVWALVSGLFIGPVINRYVEVLGWHTVFGAFLGTSGVMALGGMIGLFSGHDFSSWGSYLGIGLFGLIIVGIVGIFVRMSKTVNIVHSLFGMVIFAGYFIYDFFTLGRTENTWAKAVELTMKLYLDFLNFFLYLLQLLAELQDKS